MLGHVGPYRSCRTDEEDNYSQWTVSATIVKPGDVANRRFLLSEVEGVKSSCRFSSPGEGRVRSAWLEAGVERS